MEQETKNIVAKLTTSMNDDRPVWNDPYAEEAVEYIDKQVLEAKRRAIINLKEDFGHFNDGCSCCADLYLGGELEEYVDKMGRTADNQTDSPTS